MKAAYLIPLVLTLVPFSAKAAPVLNKSGAALTMTAFPDSDDPNLYYLAPTELSLAQNSAGVPEFSFIEQPGFWTNSAVVQASMVPSYSPSDLATAQQNILQANPQAHFAALPFTSSSVIFDLVLAKFIKKSDCNHPAGVVGQEESCSFQLTSAGANTMRSSFAKGLALTLQYQYTVSGVIEMPDHSYQAQTTSYDVAGMLGGAELAKYPQLFLDANGKTIGVGN